jgi:hypothetical protein
MQRRRPGAVVVAVALLVTGWLALTVGSTGGADDQEFDKAAATSAQGALSAVRTAQLAGRADLDGRVTRTFLSPLLDDAVRAVATAQQRLALTPPPDSARVGVRDELTKVIDEAGRATGDLVGAVGRGDDAAVRAAVDALGPIGDRLAGFGERHRA